MKVKPFKRSLKYIGLPLILCILLLLVLPLVLANQRTLELTNLETRSQLQATLFAEKVSSKLNALEILLDSLAQQTRLMDLSTQSAEKLLERIVRQNQLTFNEIEGVCILNAQGEKLFSTFFHESTKMDAIRRSIVQQHFEQELLFCSLPFVDQGEHYLSLSRSVTDSSTQIARIITLLIRTDHFHEQLNLTAVPGVEQMIVSDTEDAIVAYWAKDSSQTIVPQTITDIYPGYTKNRDTFCTTTMQGGVRSYTKEGKLYTVTSLAAFPYTLTVKGDLSQAMGSYDKALFISFSFLLLMVLIAVISIIRLSVTITKKEEEQATILEGLAQTVQERTQELEVLSAQDTLTGLPNRRKINDLLMHEIACSTEAKTLFSLLILDIDFFKQVNDTYGHQIGDAVLQQIVAVLNPIVAHKGTLARWGGDEMMVLLPGLSSSQAIDLAQKMCTAVERETFPQGVRTSLSIGVTQFHQGDTDTTLIRRADMALYKAKDAGRNQVISS